MSSVQNPDADREDYVVSVVEFAGDQGAATAALQRVFGLSESDAQTILKEVPVAVRRGVNRIRAEYFRRALELSGARVEVRDGDGSVVVRPNDDGCASAGGFAANGCKRPLAAADWEDDRVRQSSGQRHRTFEFGWLGRLSTVQSSSEAGGAEAATASGASPRAA
jgi:hypothetical protein